MPVERCQREGLPGFRWGQAGKCFTFASESGRSRARSKAETQGRAIEAARARDLALKRDIEATRWYLRDLEVRTGAGVCIVCEPPSRVIDLSRVDQRAARSAPKQSQPTAFEGQYRSLLTKRMRAIHQVIVQELEKELEPLRKEINERARKDAATQLRMDAVELAILSGVSRPEDLQIAARVAVWRHDTAASDARLLIRVIDRVRRAFASVTAITPDALLTLAEQVRGFSSRSVTRQLRTVLGIDIGSSLAGSARLLNGWVRENVDLIKSLESRYFEEIREAVLATVGEGQSTRAFSRAIQERFGVARSRADLIAVDQVGTLNAQITQARQTDLGIEEYIWSDSSDERVRELHRELDGTTRRWDDPHPTEGHPGMPIRCRCVPEPVI